MLRRLYRLGLFSSEQLAQDTSVADSLALDQRCERLAHQLDEATAVLDRMIDEADAFYADLRRLPRLREWDIAPEDVRPRLRDGLTTGEAISAFVVLKRARPTGDEAQQIAKELRDWVGKEIGPIAKPKDIRFGDNLPKTRSGKIMRRLLRDISEGRELGNVSTLADPAVVEAIRSKFNAAKA